MNGKLNLQNFIVILSFAALFENCYFNPIVNGFIDPVEKENNTTPTLGIVAALAGSRIQITGQIIGSNGFAVTNGNLNIISRTNPLPDLPISTALNESGRFFLTLSIGETAFQVEQSGTVLFTFSISIPNPGVATLVTSSVSGAGAINIEFYSNESIPNYLDIVSTSPITEGTAFTTWPTYLYITFSENLEIPSDYQSYLDANLVTSPAITLNGSFSNISGSVLTIYNSSVGSIGANTYTIGSGIKSTSGKPLKPRTLTFLCQPSCNGS